MPTSPSDRIHAIAGAPTPDFGAVFLIVGAYAVPRCTRDGVDQTVLSVYVLGVDLASIPDLQVAGDSVFWGWTLTGTKQRSRWNRKRSSCSGIGIEVWRIGASGLVATSTGYYGAATYDRQVARGIDA
jgi:hypothetical protein